MGFLFSFSLENVAAISGKEFLCVTGQINTDLHWELFLSNMAFRMCCHSFFHHDGTYSTIMQTDDSEMFSFSLLSIVDIATHIGEECFASMETMLESMLGIALYYFHKVSLITFHEFLCSSSAQHLHISPEAVHNWANSKSLNGN